MEKGPEFGCLKKRDIAYGAAIISRQRLELETVFSWTVLETFGIVSLQRQPRAERPFALLIMSVFLWKHDLW